MFLADSYAIIEYLKGNPRYKKYFEEKSFVITKLNLIEVYYSVLDEGKEKADMYYEIFLPYCQTLKDETIKKALLFRFKNKKKKLSYVDAISYQLSLDLGIKFLTGDKEFKTLSNVEFVK